MRAKRLPVRGRSRSAGRVTAKKQPFCIEATEGAYWISLLFCFGSDRRIVRGSASQLLLGGVTRQHDRSIRSHSKSASF